MIVKHSGHTFRIVLIEGLRKKFLRWISPCEMWQLESLHVHIDHEYTDEELNDFAELISEEINKAKSRAA